MSREVLGFTPSEVEQFERDGYLIGRGLTDAATVDRMRRLVFRDLAADEPPIEYEAELKYPGAPASLDAAGGRTARRLKQALNRGSVFLEWVSRPDIVTRLQQLLGPQVVCPLAHHNCVMTKQPQFSSDTGWHQDIRYWSFQRPELVTAWLALGSECHENGGLMVIPGSHRLNLPPRAFDDAKFVRADLPENQALFAARRDVTLAPGDVLFFHCLTLHAATRNHTGDPKFSVVFTFHAADNPPISGSRSAASPELLLTPGA